MFSYPLLLDENPTLGSRGYFFLIDTDGSRRIRVNEAQSAERKKELRTDDRLDFRRLPGPVFDPHFPEQRLVIEPIRTRE